MGNADSECEHVSVRASIGFHGFIYASSFKDMTVTMSVSAVTLGGSQIGYGSLVLRHLFNQSDLERALTNHFMFNNPIDICDGSYLPEH